MGLDLDAPADVARRLRMVADQMEARGVRNLRVLEALRATPRHLFTPSDYRLLAYDDRPLPIGEGQTISQPFMVALMTEALDPPPDARVLEIGTGSGYQAAVLSRLAREVYTVERRASLAATARAALAASGAANVTVIVGDGTEGAAQYAPFDRIIVTAGAPAVPQSLVSQLRDPGRLVIPVGDAGYQELRVIDVQDGVVSEQCREGCLFVPLVGRYGWPT